MASSQPEPRADSHPERAAPCGFAAGRRESKDPAFDGIGKTSEGVLRRSRRNACRDLRWSEGWRGPSAPPGGRRSGPPGCARDDNPLRRGLRGPPAAANEPIKAPTRRWPLPLPRRSTQRPSPAAAATPLLVGATRSCKANGRGHTRGSGFPVEKGRGQCPSAEMAPAPKRTQPVPPLRRWLGEPQPGGPPEVPGSRVATVEECTRSGPA